MSTTRAMAHCLQSKFVFGKVESGQAWSTGRKCNRKILQDSLLSWPHSSQWLESGKMRLISACHLLLNPQAQPAGHRLPDPLQVRLTPVLSSGEFQAKMFNENLSRKISLRFDEGEHLTRELKPSVTDKTLDVVQYWSSSGEPDVMSPLPSSFLSMSPTSSSLPSSSPCWPSGSGTGKC